VTLRAARRNSGHFGLMAFLCGLIAASCIVVPIMICDNGYFLYYGDFNAQQIPFYRLAHDAILSDETGWSHLTDLGANFIGSYSFYLLGSPFFLMTLLLPSGWVAYAMGPLLILKLACASFTAYLYLRRYVRDRRCAVIGGLLYAFSAFSVYNIFFFHFHEAIILFPLLLAAIDAFHFENRRGLVILSVFACAASNYYFFFGQVVFAAIYWLLRIITKGYRFHIKRFLLFAAECIVGVMGAAVILLPSVAALSGNYRLSEIVNGWGALLYNVKRYVQILVAFLFPGDIPAQPNFVNNAGAKWSSVALYLPMVSTVFVIAYLRKHKKSFLRILFTVLVIMAVVPALNSLYQAMNSTYYARWFYMLTLVMTLMTVKVLDRMDEYEIRKGFVPTAVVTVAIAVLIGFMPYESFRNSATVIYKLGLEQHPLRFWLFVAVSVGGLGATALLLLIRKKKPKLFIRATAVTLCVFIVGYASLYLWSGKRVASFDDAYMQRYALNGGEELTLSDVKDVRSDFYDAPDNLAMYWQVPTIQTFHSVVPASIMDFYNSSGVQRDVASRPDVSFYGMRALLSVKYLFRETGSYDKKDEKLLPGFTYLRAENGFDIFENQYYVPMGFTYDTYFTREEYLNLSDNVKHLAILKGMVLSRYQMQKYADITGYEDGMYLNLNADFDENHPQDKTYPVYHGFDSVTSGFVYSEEEYCHDAERLKEHACSDFCYTDDGFTASYENSGGDNLLFFSVPYDEGWTATVNGEPAEIEQVNLGFMAVRVKGHEKSEIVFTYTTPLLKEGIIVSAAGAGLFLIYLIMIRFTGKNKDNKRTIRVPYHIKQKSISST
jgi:uncharacterized membrane protein YfhO